MYLFSLFVLYQFLVYVRFICLVRRPEGRPASAPGGARGQQRLLRLGAERLLHPMKKPCAVVLLI